MSKFGPRKKKRFVLHPGLVVDSRTGEGRVIKAPELADLYDVKLDECVVLNKHGKTAWKSSRSDFTGFVHLYPRPNGDYRR